jgi:PAS domain S-box-containing protein
MKPEEKTQTELLLELQVLKQELISLSASYEKDLAVRKLTQQELLESTMRMNEILENSIDASYKRNLQTDKYEYISPVFEKISGYTPDDLKSLPLEGVSELHYPDDLPLTSRIIGEALSGPAGKSYELQYRFKHKKDGKYRWVLDKFMVMRNAAGEPVALIGSVSDITRRILAENENKRIQKLLEDSQRVGKIGGWEYNIDTSDLIWTSEMHQIHEVDSDYIPSIDQRVNFYTPESLSLVDKAVKKVIETGESYEIESEIITAKGNHKIVRAIGQADLQNRRIYGFFQDITGLKQAENELRLSHERFQKIFNSFQDAFFQGNLEGRLTLVSPSAAQMFGYDSEDEMVGMPVIDLYADGSARAVVLSELSGKGQIKDFNTRARRKDGSFFWVSMNVQMLYQNGQMFGTEGVVRDITERKLAEANMLESELRFETLFINSPAGLMVIDEDGIILQANGEMSRISQYALEELIGADVRMLTRTEESHQVSENIKRIFAGETLDFEFQSLRKDGSLVYLIIKEVAITLPNGKQGVLSVSNDISKRKQAEEALRKSEEKYRNIFQNVQDIFYQIDMEGKILDISPSVKKYPEYKRDLLIGSSVFDLYNDPRDRDFFLSQLKIYGELKDFELALKLDTGEIKHVSVNARLVCDLYGEPSHVDGALRDITERKQNELARKKQDEDMIRFGQIAINRENRMVQLKKEINQLLIKQGEQPKYEIFE